jgi:hypothetical protein
MLLVCQYVLDTTAPSCLRDVVQYPMLSAGYRTCAGNQGRSMMSSSPANCPSALAVTSVSDYDGMPGALSTPANETDLDDTFTDFSNWGNNDTASRTIAGPGAQRSQQVVACDGLRSSVQGGCISIFPSSSCLSAAVSYWCVSCASCPCSLHTQCASWCGQTTSAACPHTAGAFNTGHAFLANQSQHPDSTPS